MSGRYSLADMLNTDVMPTRRHMPGPHGEIAPTTGWDDDAIFRQRLQALQQKKTGMLQSQSKSPLGENAPSFYDDMAAINQAIPALGQKVANPNAPISFAPDRGRVSVMNPAQAASNGQRLAGNRLGALADLSSARSLDAMNVGNARAEETEMADPDFGDVAGAKARYAGGAARRYAALGRQSMGGF